MQRLYYCLKIIRISYKKYIIINENDIFNYEILAGEHTYIAIIGNRDRMPEKY